jgi:outer membrane lipoprotein-sorting protein
MKNILLVVAIGLLFPLLAFSQTGKEIVTKMNDNAYGGKLYSAMKMTIVRPKWTRSMTLKSWSDGQDYSLILITGPAREKGITYLKRKREMWNFQPSISRTIKMPPSMMSQSWMGSDFKNDDLVRQSSIVDDYSHQLVGKETIEGLECYKVELIPNPEAPVVWGKVILWIDTQNHIQLKAEQYDEDIELVQTMLGQNIKKMDGRTLATKQTLIPADKKGHQTVMEYTEMDFGTAITDSFFSTQNMKRVR